MPAADRQIVRVDGRSISLGSLDKVMYPADGFTEAHVLDYYARVAWALVPLTAGRPVTRKRWVHGVGTPDSPQPSFFAKQLEPGAPDWLPTVAIDHTDRRIVYPLIEDTAGLVWIVRSGALELHVPQWRWTGAGRSPDRMVIDLDPGPGTGLAEAATVALLVREILTGMGLDPLPVTSGAKGIHVYTRVRAGMTTDAVSAVAHELARALEADHPDLVVSDMAKSRRIGKVLVDWSQNAGGKTTVAPYSLRGTWSPAVAAPRTWDELASPDLRQLRPDEVLERLGTHGDLLAPLHDGRTAPERATAEPGVVPRPAPPAPADRAARSGTLPMLPSPLSGAPDPAHEWAVEMKWDGARTIATVDGDAVRLTSRTGLDVTAAYPELQALAAAVGAPAVLDGEIVAFDARGRPDFGRLQTRMGRSRAADARRAAASTPLAFLAFDLLELDRLSLAERPWAERRAALERTVTAGDVVRLPPVVVIANDAAAITAALRSSRERGLEGIVLKRTDSTYRPGSRTTDWLKVKFEEHVEVVVGGWWPGTAPEGLGSLLVGVFRPDGSLHLAGRVGTGFTSRERRRILERLAPLERTVDPFADASADALRDVRFVEPTLVGEVRFTGWTRSGHLRHPSWRGWREDRTSDELLAAARADEAGRTP